MSLDFVLGVDSSIQAKFENALRVYLDKLRDKNNHLLWTCKRSDSPRDSNTQIYDKPCPGVWKDFYGAKLSYWLDLE